MPCATWGPTSSTSSSSVAGGRSTPTSWGAPATGRASTATPRRTSIPGQGLNIQTSYLFNHKWEIALRNSTLFPSDEIRPLAGYRNRNQTTLGITRYIIGHSLKVQADFSYDSYSERDPRIIPDNFNRWQLRFHRELGL